MIRALLAILAALVVAPAAAPAATWSIYPGDSINAALTAAAPGDIVRLHAGVYPLETITAAKTGYVYLQPYPNQIVRIGGLEFAGASHIYLRYFNSLSGINSASTTTDAVKISRGSSYIVVLANRITGSRVGVRVSGTSATATWPAHISIAGNDISGSYVDAIQVGGGRHVEIRANTLHDTQLNDLHNDGVQSYASEDLQIVRNRVYFTNVTAGTPGNGIIIGHGDLSWQRVTATRIENNLVHQWPGTALTIAGSTDTIVDNNTLYDSGLGFNYTLAISSKNNPSLFANVNLTVANNIIERVAVVNGAARPDVETHNLVADGGGGDLITSDPMFTGGYQLDPASPARDTADGLYAPLVDVDGKTRDSLPDSGAREYR